MTWRFGISPNGTSALIGSDSIVSANIYAPKGTIWLQADTRAEGAFLGRQILLGVGVTVTLKSGF